MKTKYRSCTVEFEVDLPDRLGMPDGTLLVHANINPGMPGTRWEPTEPPFVEEMWVENEQGIDVSDFLARNNDAWDWLENRCLEQGE